MSAVGDARKRLADLARASGGADAQAAALAPPGSPGLAGYFVAGNADGDPIIWRDDNCPEPVNGIEGWKVRRDHPGLWDAIVALIEGSAP